MAAFKKTVDEIIDDLLPVEKSIVKRLRALITECLPQAIEKNNYGVPFYTRNRMICFIWPPSIPWGPRNDRRAAKGVSLGFCYGYLMANEDKALLAEGRKQVYVMYFKTLKEINENHVRALLFEAWMIDQQFKKRKNRQTK